MNSRAVQSWKWQLIGKSQWRRSATLQLTNAPPPQSTTPGLHPVNIHQMAPPARDSTHSITVYSSFTDQYDHFRLLEAHCVYKIGDQLRFRIRVRVTIGRCVGALFTYTHNITHRARRVHRHTFRLRVHKEIRAAQIARAVR